MHVVITKASIVTINATARELTDTMHTVSEWEQSVIKFWFREEMVNVGVVTSIGFGASIVGQRVPWNRVIGMIFSLQATVCRANVHLLSSVVMSVQVTLVWLVVVGQLPQFDARML